MDFLVAVNTDVGIKKKNNQDSVLVMEADTDLGKVLFAVVCDGMGGLAKGEVASAALIREYARWFEHDFPAVLYSGMSQDKLRSSMENVIYSMNSKIGSFGRNIGINLGTTVVALIIHDGKYYCVNVGDSRCYRIKNSMNCITKDQTYVAREIEMGRMTPEEAEKHPQRSVLLQCVGASEVIVPDFFTGEAEKDELFMLCSDGYRHVISNDEFYQYLNPNVLHDEAGMNESIKYFVELNKYRKETDNISVILIRTN
ncbi:PP2C family protein-serine/threonine phosphatase [Lachnospiraceae bacterium HCP1S3_C3]|nr:serine/threonine-protein phosphatase [Lachnospiraceae bacterium]